MFSYQAQHVVDCGAKGVTLLYGVAIECVSKEKQEWDSQLIPCLLRVYQWRQCKEYTMVVKVNQRNKPREVFPWRDELTAPETQWISSLDTRLSFLYLLRCELAQLKQDEQRHAIRVAAQNMSFRLPRPLHRLLAEYVTPLLIVPDALVLLHKWPCCRHRGKVIVGIQLAYAHDQHFLGGHPLPIHALQDMRQQWDHCEHVDRLGRALNVVPRVYAIADDCNRCS